MAAGATGAELSGVTIQFPNVFINGENLQFTKFISYRYKQDFLIPADQWSFAIEADRLTDLELTAITPRTRVEFYIDGLRQTVGYIDEIKVQSERGTGSVMTIEGRDWLSPAVDSQIDPKTRFQPTMTILDVVTEVFSAFGLKTVTDDNTANKNAITGAKYGVKTSKKGKPLKSAINHQLKPYPNEGAFAFASRVTQRAGLWIWPGADGETVIVGEPDFDQEPRYSLWHTRDSSSVKNNVERSDVTQSAKDQPSVIIATGFGGGGVYAKSTLKGGIFNPVVDLDNQARTDILNAYPEITFLGLPASTAAFEPITEPNARPLFLYDPEAHTQDQLNSFLYRELSLKMRRSLSARYTTEGHKLNGQPVAVDTIVAIEDDASNLHTSLWVLNREFSKGAGQESMMTLELIRPGSLIFGPNN